MATDKKQETPVAAQGFSLAQLDSSSWLPWRRTKPGVINKTTKCIHYASWQLAEERAFASLREKCDNYSSLKLPEENVRAPGREKDAEQESGSVSKIAEAVKEVLRNIEDRTSFGVLKPSDNYTLVDSECERFLFYTLEESPGLPRLLKVWFKLTILSDDTVAWGISEASGFHAGPFFGAYTLKADAKALDVAMAVSFSENSILKDNCVPESVPGSTAHGPSRQVASGKKLYSTPANDDIKKTDFKMATDKKQETPVAAQGFSLAQSDSSSWLPWRRTKPGVINKTTKCIHYASWQLAEERAFASLREKCDNYSSLKLPEENARAPGREKDAEQESGSVSKIAEAVKEVLRNIEDRTSFGVLKPSDNYTLVDSECERFLFYTLEESPGLPRLLKVWFKLTILSDDTVAWGISEASGFHAGPFFGAYTLKADAKALDVAMAVSFSENSILKDNCVPESVPGSTAHGPSRRASSTMTPQQIGYLQEQGFPNGLARELGNTRATYPLRFWVVDNSGSMRTNDGHQLRGAPNKIRVVPCNRWTELQGAVEYHAELAGILEATTTFRMLNDPGPKVGPQEFTVASDAAHIPVQSEVNQAVKITRKSEPSGVTPLSEHLQEIRLRIEAVAPSLKAGGQQAVIVLATDGLPSDKKGESKEAVKNEFLASLRSLQNLPVWVVIRLCTDDEEIVTFYNDLDAVLELPFEVIDDFFGEGKEIYSANKWLNYGLPLHRCREMGYHHRIFDLLDERLLNKDELREFLELLFGADTLRNAPDIHLDWKGFASIVKQVVYANGTIFNPYTKRLDYWVDMKQLEKCYDNTRGFRLFGRRK